MIVRAGKLPWGMFHHPCRQRGCLRHLLLWGPFISPCRPCGYTDGLRHLLLWGPFISPCRPCCYIDGWNQLTDSRAYFCASSCVRQLHLSLRQVLLPTVREGNVFTGVCLSTIGHIATRSLLGLVTAQSVCILLECFLVLFHSRTNYSSFYKYITLTASKNTMKFSLYMYITVNLTVSTLFFDLTRVFSANPFQVHQPLNYLPVWATRHTYTSVPWFVYYLLKPHAFVLVLYLLNNATVSKFTHLMILSHGH